MGLFDKKHCDICGGKIGLLGNNKLEDGNLCNDCEKKLSQWFKDRRHATLEQIREQLAYREENAAALASFSTTKQLGTDGDKFFLIDEKTERFIVLREGEDMKKNPDLLERARVRNAALKIEEDKSEVKRKNPDGQMESYHPKHYSYKYRFYIEIDYDGRFFDQIRFPLSYVAVNGGTDDDQYVGETLKDVLADQFASQFNLQPASNTKVVQVDRYGRRHDLPGGYRTDGLTTMKELDIEFYQEYVRLGGEIVEWLLGGAIRP